MRYSLLFFSLLFAARGNHPTGGCVNRSDFSIEGSVVVEVTLSGSLLVNPETLGKNRWMMRLNTTHEETIEAECTDPACGDLTLGDDLTLHCLHTTQFEGETQSSHHVCHTLGETLESIDN